MEPELLGFKQVQTKSPYEEKRYNGPATLVYYKSGKILVQGKNTEKYKEILGLSSKNETKEEIDKVQGLIIGSDETLKGDTFGGLVVAGFMADDKVREKLSSMGVMDSKKIDDYKISLIAEKLIEQFPKNYDVISLNPLEYNQYTREEKTTVLLNKLHRQVNNALKTEKSTHIVDKYPGCKAGDISLERAESEYLEVAAASIIARDAGLKQLKELSVKSGMHIPKGSTHVNLALKKLKEKKLPPEEYVKLNFSNVKKVFFE